MAEKTEDLNLPLAVITRIIKDALPDGVMVSREARVAIARAASVFVLYATATANGYASKAKRKTLSANDVIEAMKDMEFEELVEPLLDALNSWKQSCKAKKTKPAPSTKSKTAPEADQDEENIETIDLEESGEHEEEENHIARESDADDSENAED